MNLKAHWWKILASLLLIFVIFCGFYFPLSPGIKSYSPASVATGDTLQLDLVTEGTSFQKHPENLQAFLVFDSIQHIESIAVNIIDDEHITATFPIPILPLDTNEYKLMDIYLNSDYDGDIYLPSAVSLHRTSDSLKIPMEYRHTEPIKVNHTASAYFSFPNRELLKESIRNLFFHVPMWFGMTILLFLSMIYSLLFLSKKKEAHDLFAASLVKVAVLMGVLGLLTGAQWAKITWGAWWNNDPKQMAAAVGVLMYLAYLLLRNSVDDIDKRASVASVTNVLFFFIFIPMIYIVPRLMDSLHPGNGGNPGFKTYDLDDHMRIFFYPAVAGWTLMGLWLATIGFRISRLEMKLKQMH